MVKANVINKFCFFAYKALTLFYHLFQSKDKMMRGSRRGCVRLRVRNFLFISRAEQNFTLSHSSLLSIILMVQLIFSMPVPDPIHTHLAVQLYQLELSLNGIVSKFTFIHLTDAFIRCFIPHIFFYLSMCNPVR